MLRSYILLFLFSTNLFAQNSKLSIEKDYYVNIKKSESSINVDGKLDKNEWNNAEVAKDFYLNFPFDSSYAVSKYQTEVKLLFDDHFLYVGAKCYQPKDEIIISSLKRDFEIQESDVFVVNFDTFSDKLNAFHFAVNPYGVQREGLIIEGGEISTYWDNKWYAETQIYDDFWTVEIAIPFKTLRYKVGGSNINWNVNFIRQTIKSNQVSSWVPVPRFFEPDKLAYTGVLNWEENPPHPGTNISLIPFLTASAFKETPRNYNTLKPETPVSNQNFGYGLDAKIGITSSLNLDITLNPDFSQVEVDRQVTNLSRFELFFPERRQFFLENNDLFGQFGFPSTRPFFSRRIGITQNPHTGLSEGVPIIAGARLSGKIDENWRVGLMNMQTKKVDFGEDHVLPASNYTVGVLQRKLFQRSTLGGVFINKQNQLKDLSNTQSQGFDPYNRVAGLDLNLNSNDGRIESETYYHHSFRPTPEKDAGSFGQFIGYSHPNVGVYLGGFRIGENFNPEAGFVPRTGVWQTFRSLNFRLNPKNEGVSKYVNTIGLDISGDDAINFKGKVYDSQTTLSTYINNFNRAEFRLFYELNFTHLFFDYDPTNTFSNPNPDKRINLTPLPIGDYRYQSFGLAYSSSIRHPVYGNVAYKRGTYYNGKADFLELNLHWRVQPYGTIALDANYSDIRLPAPYNSASYWLIGPRAEMAFSKNLFSSLFLQYNSQINNTNINARLQWRFKPVSDLFLVYTENFFAEAIPKYAVPSWAPKNRALTLKLTYWLNL